MKDKFFLDSNIVLYLFDIEPIKKSVAINLIRQKPVISTQVIIETLNISIRKLKLSKELSFKNAEYLMTVCNLILIEKDILIKSFDIARKYKFSHLDSLIIASAIEGNCNILYSEDLQHKQKIENKLQIINPFI